MKYKILKMIGKGSYAEVFLGVNNLTSGKVAIKRFYTKNKDIRESFINEIKICKIITDKINCPYLIKMLDMYTDSNYTYLVLEYAPHGDLESFISKSFKKNKGLNEKTIDRIILQVKEAISCLHKNDIIHRDIKSSNILIFDKKNIKISDFGVSKLLENNVFARSSIGTPYYMSPAILRGEKYSFNVDYWALGCLIYKMVTNKYPFEAENLPRLVKKIKESKYDKYSIPDKYKNLIIDLLNPRYDRELLDIDLKRRNNEIEDFISYNCKTFINSPSNKYFKSKILQDDDDDADIPLYYNENKNHQSFIKPTDNIKPTNNILQDNNKIQNVESSDRRSYQLKEITKLQNYQKNRHSINNNLPPINYYQKNNNNDIDYESNLIREEKIKNFYRRKELVPIDKPIYQQQEYNKPLVYDIKVNENRPSNNNPYRRKELVPIDKPIYQQQEYNKPLVYDIKVNENRPSNNNQYKRKSNRDYNFKDRNRNNSYNSQIFLEPMNDKYKKKNKFFLGKNFIKENKLNIIRINKINNIIKDNKFSRKQLNKLINDTSLKKAPKNYLDNIKKNAFN